MDTNDQIGFQNGCDIPNFPFRDKGSIVYTVYVRNRPFG